MHLIKEYPAMQLVQSAGELYWSMPDSWTAGQTEQAEMVDLPGNGSPDSALNNLSWLGGDGYQNHNLSWLGGDGYRNHNISWFSSAEKDIRHIYQNMTVKEQGSIFTYDAVIQGVLVCIFTTVGGVMVLVFSLIMIQECTVSTTRPVLHTLPFSP